MGGDIVLAEDGQRKLTLESILQRAELEADGGLGLRRRLAGRIQGLRAFLDGAERQSRLSLGDRKRIVDQAIVLFEQNYAHLPLKRNMHAVDPVQGLRLLRLRLDSPESYRSQLPERAFHRRMISIFTSVRDLHSRYLLPEPYKKCVAFLPFSVGECFDTGNRQGKRPKYVVTDVMKGFDHPTFRPGAELCRWNAVPIARRVERVADQHAGSNPAARRVRGLTGLTLRPLSIAMAPDEEWVEVEFLPPPLPTAVRPPDGPQSIRVYWHVYSRSAQEKRRDVFLERLAQAALETVRDELGGEGSSPLSIPRSLASSVSFAALVEDEELPFELGVFSIPPGAGRALREDAPSFERGDGLDLEGEFIRAARHDLFPPIQPMKDEPLKPIPTYDPSIFQAFAAGEPGAELAFIRICTFQVPDIDSFVAGFAAVLRSPELPRRGLLLDVRGNAGGRIPAGERLLQLLTPRTIEPALFQFVNTPVNLDFCRRYVERARREGKSQLFDSWIPSMERSVATGSTYSRGFPVTAPASCNDIGQLYHGPVVLLIDADCYSTTDIFIAGFQDHRIGRILAVHENTGAGGASTVTQSTLARVFGAGSAYRPLPHRAEMQIALRRSVRVLDNAGTPLEDLGIERRPGIDEIYCLSREDVVYGAGYGIYAHAAEMVRRE